MGLRTIKQYFCDGCGEDLSESEIIEYFDFSIRDASGERTAFSAELGGKCRDEMRKILDMLREKVQAPDESGDTLPPLETLPKTSTTNSGVRGLSQRELGRRVREWWRTSKDAKKRFGEPKTRGMVPTAVVAAYLEAVKERSGEKVTA